MVEFALVLVPLLLLIFGLIDLGRAVYVNNSLAEAAREGARWGSVQARSSDAATVEAYTLERLVSVPGATVTAACLSSGPPILGCRMGDVLEVTVHSDLEMITPIIAQLLGGFGLNPIDLTASSQVTVNN
jgi:Flp pilus assembly protein TadG